jgi:hypothetical protein
LHEVVKRLTSGHETMREAFDEFEVLLDQLCAECGIAGFREECQPLSYRST